MKTSSASNIQIARRLTTVLLSAFVSSAGLVGCGKFGSSHATSTVVPAPTNYSDALGDEGGQIGSSKSDTRTVDQVKLGGGSVRTSSASTSFKMVSGVGVQ